MEFKEVIITFKAENEFFNKIIDWINQNDIFWLADLRKAFGVEEGDKDYSRVKYALDVLKKERILQCCDVKSGCRQYMAVKKIPHRTVEIAKATLYREAFNLPLPPKGAMVKTGKMYTDHDKLIHYIFWVDCPDEKCVLFSGISSNHFTIKIINSFGWEIDKKVIPKIQVKIIEGLIRNTVKEVNA